MNKKQKRFFNFRQNPNEDLLWNEIPIEILGSFRTKINEDMYDISTNLQNVFNDTTEKSLKNLHDIDTEMYQNILKSLKFDDYLKLIHKKLNQLDEGIVKIFMTNT